MVVHPFNSNTWEEEAGELEASPVSSKTARATERDPVSRGKVPMEG